MGEVGRIELWKEQTFGRVETKKPGVERLVSTYRPIEVIFTATKKSPEDFQGKDILNVGAGKTHWGFELISRYRVFPKRFENADISYAEQPVHRRIVGKVLMAESVADVKQSLPYKNDSFDILWCSYAPANWKEFLRVVRPGGEIFVLGGDVDGAMALELSQKLGVPVICQEINETKIEEWANKAGKNRNAILPLRGKNILTVKKPRGETV